MVICIVACLHIINLKVEGQKLVNGIVKDAGSGKGISDVTILINEGTYKSKTDKNGKFKIVTMNNTDTLKFYHEEYQNEFKVIGDNVKILVDLKQNFNGKNTDIGYGNLQKKNITSSVVTLEEKDFNKGNNNDIYSLLRGKVPGLIIRHSIQNPNEKPIIMMRGPSNFNQDAEPLIVLDGVSDASINSVDPNDVESVTVLKDSSAQAIYGSRATAGVIIIKTKKGKIK